MALIEELELSCITLGERGTDCGGRRHTQLSCHNSVAGAAGQLGELHCTDMLLVSSGSYTTLTCYWSARGATPH